MKKQKQLPLALENAIKRCEETSDMWGDFAFYLGYGIDLVSYKNGSSKLRESTQLEF